MDFSKSLSFGENTFLEIDNCEAKVKVCDEEQLLLKPNVADSDNGKIEKSSPKFQLKSIESVEKAGMRLALEKSIMSKLTDISTLGKQHSENTSHGKEKRSKQSTAVSILHETISISKR